MQTKQQIQQLLASAGTSPNKRRGQHFLIDLNLMRLLVDRANITENDVVLEAGCGTGSMTEALCQQGAKVIAVEIDDTLAQIAENQLKKQENVEIIISDILESKNTIDHKIVTALQRVDKPSWGRVLLVSNLPYSVAAPVMLNLITGPVTADAMYVTVQKEVAERMTAVASSKDYGTLSILMAATGQVKIERILKPTVFWPAPQVDSAMVSFVRHQDKINRIHDIGILSELVSLFMQHRRKMLRAASKFASGRLAQISKWSTIFEDSFVDARLRPEQITPENYMAIANLCYERISSK